MRRAERCELKRGGADIELAQPAGASAERQEFVLIKKYRDLPEALLAKSALESAGIPCILGDENVVRLDWFWSNLMGGIKLLVKAEDAQEAREILEQPTPEAFDVEGVGSYQQPRCPKCNSMDISFEELNRPIAFGSAAVGLPLPVHNSGWKCHACGNSWHDHDENRS